MHNTLKEDADNGALRKQTSSWKLSHNTRPPSELDFRPRLSQPAARSHVRGLGRSFIYFILATPRHKLSDPFDSTNSKRGERFTLAGFFFVFTVTCRTSGRSPASEAMDELKVYKQAANFAQILRH